MRSRVAILSTSVETVNRIPGTHRWEEAPSEVAFLRTSHRHVFVVRCSFPVSYSRQREFYLLETKIDEWFDEHFTRDAVGSFIFGGMSCEDIATQLLLDFDGMEWCRVSEDGEEAAVVRREH